MQLDNNNADFDAHDFVATQLPEFTQLLGLTNVQAEAQTSAPPLNISDNHDREAPNADTVSIAVAAAAITNPASDSLSNPASDTSHVHNPLSNGPS